jgi:hypothetical protein
VRMDTAGEFKELNNSGSSSFLKGWLQLRGWLF